MKIELDYSRISQSIFALVALKAASEGTAPAIGRYQQPALHEMMATELLTIALRLGNNVTGLNAAQGIIEVEGNVSAALFRQTLESTLSAIVLHRLNLADDPAELIMRLRQILNPLPSDMRLKY